MYSWSCPDVPLIPLSVGIPDQLAIFDTATQAMKLVGPKQGEARMYVCGITPYDATHLGHAHTYLTFDLVNRIWRDLGLSVHYVQNVTDVDDPLLERANQTGQDWKELATAQVNLFRTDMQALRVIPPQEYLGAVESIPLIVELIERLKTSGLVYQIDDPDYPDWYFHSIGVPVFGEVSHLTEDEEIKLFAERGGDPLRPGKKHPLDCLLWRCKREGEPAWNSALGAGRPGWHIECAAIALKCLGPDFDLQGGGSDLIFPHHEMSAAEAFAASGKPLASSFVHSGMVALAGEKMSKSKGNLELVSRLRDQGVDPMVIRLALLDHHYRSDWEWTKEDLVKAQDRLDRWREVGSYSAGISAEDTIAQVRMVMRNDLNAPAALQIVDDWVTANLVSPGEDPQAIGQMFSVVDAVLGVAI